MPAPVLPAVSRHAASVRTALLLALLLLGSLCLVVPSAAAPATPAAGDQRTGTRAIERDYTLQLRDLFAARREGGLLTRLAAEALLQRPTEGDQDPAGDGYRRKAKRICGPQVCVHFVTRGGDAPPSRAWARRTLRVMQKVWRHEVGKLGFRRPPTDRRRGGDKRFDVYLKDVGDRGLFGYCTPERRVKGEQRAASSYCVLDNDFARNQFRAPPKRSLRVTSAHEFFHAIQFGYDFLEDPWLMETTATWVEESFADGANDNRRYLRFGNLHRPWVSLDRYSNTSYAQYGNWPFWQFLVDRFGAGVVRAVWRQADQTTGAPRRYSVAALRHVLRKRTGDRRALARILTSYAVRNLDPARTYAEGRAWPAPRISRTADLGKSRPRRTWQIRIDHLAAKHVLVRPRTKGFRRLIVKIDAPRRRSAVTVTVVRRDGSLRRRSIHLSGGVGRLRVGFGSKKVAGVLVTAVNTSARYRCGRDTQLACGGVPKDDSSAFAITVRAVRR